MPKLAKRTVDAIEPQAKEFFIWDESISVFPTTQPGVVLRRKRKPINVLPRTAVGLPAIFAERAQNVAPL